ncbi:MAG: hypothetical protein A2Y74_00520 [Actinobacteria bacterium RBG_13_63_9]|nr:MAG: hypothetical protein A2Y74_00520 [Actinobacteria bacterium RBG_13_63_9]
MAGTANELVRFVVIQMIKDGIRQNNVEFFLQALPRCLADRGTERLRPSTILALRGRDVSRVQIHTGILHGLGQIVENRTRPAGDIQDPCPGKGLNVLLHVTGAEMISADRLLEKIVNCGFFEDAPDGVSPLTHQSKALPWTLSWKSQCPVELSRCLCPEQAFSRTQAKCAEHGS